MFFCFFVSLTLPTFAKNFTDMAKKYIIYISKENRKKLRESFGVSDSLVSNALTFSRESEKCRMIRSAAVNYYSGVIV